MNVLTENINKLTIHIDNVTKNVDKSSINIDKILENLSISSINIEKIMENSTKNIDKFIAEGIKHRKISEKLLNEQTTSIQTMNAAINGYIKNEANLIENEINRQITTYLKNDIKFKDCNIFDIQKNWQYLNKPTIDPNFPTHTFINKTQHPITEFDGIYIITNDLGYCPGFPEIKQIRYNSNQPTKKPQHELFKQFLIVEAKHSITRQEIIKKVKQIQELQKYIQIKPTQLNLTTEFKNINSSLLLNEFKGEIILIFGSEDMDDSRATQIETGHEDWKKLGILAGYVKCSGERYELYENENNFKAKKLVYAQAVRTGELEIAGGRKRKLGKKI